MQQTNFQTISQHYDAFLCDLWGVIHDGDALYPNVLSALEQLHLAGKKLVFLSNAPRLAESVSVKMDKMGVRRDWYFDALTSGEGAIAFLNAAIDPFTADKSYYYLGLEMDETLLPHLPQKRVADIAQADFILNSNFEFLGQTRSEVQSHLQQAISRKLPMVCINPDMEVIKMDGTKIECAGAIAEDYKAMGGEVAYVGKPYSLVFELAYKKLGSPRKDKVLMIGDNLLTDIKGGNGFGIDTAFVTQGILQNQKQGDVSAQEYCESHAIMPTHIIEGL